MWCRSLLRVLNWSTRQNQVITSEASEKVNSFAVNLICRWLANATWRRAVFLQNLSSFHVFHSSWLQNGVFSTEFHLKTCFHCTRLSFLFLSPNNIICFLRQRYVFYKVNQKNTCESELNPTPVLPDNYILWNENIHKYKSTFYISNQSHKRTQFKK